MSYSIGIRLPADLAKRLDALAKRTQRPKAEYVREALELQLDRIEWEQDLLQRRDDIRSGRVATISSADMRDHLGLDS